MICCATSLILGLKLHCSVLAVILSTVLQCVSKTNFVVAKIPVLEDQLSPQTRGPRTSCLPGHLVLGLDVPHQDGCPPRTIVQRSFNMEVLVDHGEMELEYHHIYNYAAFSHYPTSSSKNQCRIIQRKCIEHFRVEDRVLYYSACRKVCEQD